MISKETIDSVFERMDIADVVSEFVKLRKKGVNYVGYSPFANEKTPSFVVSPAKGIFKCFSSGKGGNAVKFLMELEKHTYPEAIKWLADRYKIAFQEDITEKDKGLKLASQEIYSVNDFALKVYSGELQDNKDGWNYLKERRITQDSVTEFQLGFAPAGGSFLTELAEANHYTHKSLMLADVSNVNRYDKFQERIIFPICTISGRIAGFSGRLIKPNDKYPKYINTGDNEVFKKGSLLFGMHIAKKHITKKDGCNILEGPIDVISVHQAGIKNTVCSSGTALTKEQLAMIKRFTDRVTIMYDGDSAGFKAAARGIELCIEVGLSVRVIIFPAGEDPHSFIVNYGEDTFAAFIDESKMDMVDFFLRDIDTYSPEEQDEAKKLILSIIGKIPADESRRIDSYVSKLSRKYAVKKVDLYRYINKTAKPSVALIAEQQSSVTTLHNDEHEIARLLVRYGNQLMWGDHYVYYHLLHGLDVEAITDELVKAIITSYVSDYLEKGVIPTVDDLIKNSNPDISEFVTNAAIDLYQISEQWEGFDVICGEKFVKEVMSGHYTYQLNTYTKKINRNIEAIRNSDDEEAITALISQNKAYEKLQKSIADKLGVSVI